MCINDYWWTLSAYSGLSYRVFEVFSDGYVYDTGANVKNNAVRPATTLSSEVQITGGIGTESDPYEISL